MPDLATIQFGSVSFEEALQALRDLVPMSEADFAALSAVDKNRAFSFAEAYSDSMAEAARKVLEGVVNGDIPVGEQLAALNAALEPFGQAVTPFQADTIFQTTMNRVYNSGYRTAFNSPGLVASYPYRGHVSADDIRVRPNHFALDYRRIRGVFRREDFIWQQMSSPLGYRCRCWDQFFSQAEVDAQGLAVLRGEDFYGKSVEVQVPGHGPVVCQCLPDPGFGTSGLTGKSAEVHQGVSAEVSTLGTFNLGTFNSQFISLAVICLAARAEARELVAGNSHRGKTVPGTNAGSYAPGDAAKTYKTENRPALSTVSDAPKLPEAIDAKAGADRLMAGFDAHGPMDRTARFDREVLQHWEKEDKLHGDIKQRLEHLDAAVASIEQPYEIWHQGGQDTYVAAFRSPSGKIVAATAFRIEAGKIKSYWYTDDANSLNKVRWGKLIYAR